MTTKALIPSSLIRCPIAPLQISFMPRRLFSSGADPDEPPSAAERAYLRLRQALASGEIVAGRPLDIRRLGDGLRLSATPVREALARLEAEQLVSFVRHKGYFATRPTATVLRDLYALNEGLLLLACESMNPRRPIEQRSAPADLPLRPHAIIAGLEADILAHQTNEEVRRIFDCISVRLALARLCEERIFPDAAEEAKALDRFWRDRDLAGLRRGVAAYHGRRRAAADRIARCVARWRPIHEG